MKPLKLSTSCFFSIVICIVALGLWLRIQNYDSIPPFENKDEFMYPWAGMTLIKDGIPTSWSWVREYKNKFPYEVWGMHFMIVSPWIHKPLMYPLITGSFMLATGAKKFKDVRLSKLRLIPISINLITIALLALAGTLLFDQMTGLLSALFYATIPSIVLGNRMSLVENALIPLSVLCLILASSPKISKSLRPYIYGFIFILALQLKQIALYLPLSCILFYLLRRKYKEVLILTSFCFVSVALYFLIGCHFVSLEEFIELNRGLAKHHTGGGPNLINVLFQQKWTNLKVAPEQDMFMLMGYMLLLSSPFWLLQLVGKFTYGSLDLVILIPFSYLILLQIVESGSSAYYGWHFFPLFPFVSILLAVAWMKIYRSSDFFSFLPCIIILAPLLNFSKKLEPNYFANWQLILIIMLILAFASSFSKKIRKISLIAFLIASISLNIFRVQDAPNTLPVRAQPL